MREAFPGHRGTRRRIGLLGGSFNPAHEGHRHLSLIALKRLGLDEVWWLVSPQNPLKPRGGMAGVRERLEQARRTARHPRIRVGDLESGLATRYTADTVRRLRALLPRTRFVWLMGADNLAQIGRWGRWTLIFHSLPVAVCDRPTYSLSAFAGVAAKRFARSRWRERRVGRLAAAEPPAWTFLHGPLHPASATAIRAGQPRRRRIGS